VCGLKYAANMASEKKVMLSAGCYERFVLGYDFLKSGEEDEYKLQKVQALSTRLQGVLISD
jgi:hypothetical protein